MNHVAQPLCKVEGQYELTADMGTRRQGPNNIYGVISRGEIGVEVRKLSSHMW